MIFKLVSTLEGGVLVNVEKHKVKAIYNNKEDVHMGLKAVAAELAAVKLDKLVRADFHSSLYSLPY